MPFLMDLCPEILEEVIMKLESVEDVIALGSCSPLLARIVGQASLWRIIFSKTDLVENGRVMEDRIRNITTFLTTLEDSDAIFFLLHQTIVDRFPATEEGEEEENITVSCPSSPQLQHVSGLGLQLLALTDREGARHTVHEIKMSSISSSLLLSLASLHRDQISELVVESGIHCTTEEEGSALVSLLERSTTWMVRWLYLYDEVGQLTWEGLARVVARGKFERVRAPDREVVRRGRREDLWAVWQNVEYGWEVDEEWIMKLDGEEEGWKTIEEMIQ